MGYLNVPSCTFDWFVFNVGGIVVLFKTVSWSIPPGDNAVTPWKINIVHLQITHLERKMIWTKPPGNYLQNVTKIFRGVFKHISLLNATPPALTIEFINWWNLYLVFISEDSLDL